MWADLSALAADEMQGRKPGSNGHKLARQYIRQRFKQTGLLAYHNDFMQHFKVRGKPGINVVAGLKGELSQTLVITAHYDHLGRKGRKIFNGADDNASGVAAMLELARQFKQKHLKHSIIFVATDAEELGLYGAKAFLDTPPIPIGQIIANINLDMIANGGRKKKLYLAGGKAFPELKPVIKQAIQQASLCLVAGHDTSSRSYDRSYSINWKRASDHYAFIKRDIPYLFFSVADHKYYHSEMDTVERIDPMFYAAAVETIFNSINIFDRLYSQKR